jgi:hypothetical protein
VTYAAPFSVTCRALNLILGNQYPQILEQRLNTVERGKLVLANQYLQASMVLKRDDLVLRRNEFLLLLIHELPLHVARYISNVDSASAPEPLGRTDHDGRWRCSRML